MSGFPALPNLAVQPPVEPMLASPKGSVVPAPDSVAGGLAYEPKWDGFRCLLFRDGEQVVVQGRGGKDLSYAFPEITSAALQLLPDRCVLDGELVIAHDGRLWFEEMTMRIRPRSEAGGWKIAEMAQTMPSEMVVFDVLALGGDSLIDATYAERRARLEALDLRAPFHRTPMTCDAALAGEWFRAFEGAGLDGVIAKPLNGTYQPGKRTLFKVKHARTADVVVAGWRAHKAAGAGGREVVGSLLLGLYDEAGVLQHVGAASAFSAARRAELVEELEPFAASLEGHPWGRSGDEAAHAEQRMPGSPSRWSGGKDMTWHPLLPALVAEVGYDHMEGTRFRHVAAFVRWRPDRDPLTCTYAQLERPVKFDLADLL